MSAAIALNFTELLNFVYFFLILSIFIFVKSVMMEKFLFLLPCHLSQLFLCK